MLIFGPVPSRRLGQSLGVNHIPPKTCSYACFYCQLGKTYPMEIKRKRFYSPEEIDRELTEKLQRLKETGEPVDWVTFVPDGEPTLDVNLKEEIMKTKAHGLKTAVISNASLMSMEEVQEALMQADWVSMKVDAGNDPMWRKVNRPYGSLRFDGMIQGIIDFSKRYQGILVTESMVIKGANDSESEIDDIARVLSEIRPKKSYFMVPIRPPAENWVERPDVRTLRHALRIVQNRCEHEIACITGDESEERFYVTDAIANDILSITSVHPVRETVIRLLLEQKHADFSLIDDLVAQKKLLAFSYEGKTFYRRNLA